MTHDDGVLFSIMDSLLRKAAARLVRWREIHNMTPLSERELNAAVAAELRKHAARLEAD